MAGRTRLGAQCVLWGALAGCTSLVPPDPLPASLAIPAGWSMPDVAGAGAAGPGTGTLTDWWQRFDDPQLVGLVEAALKANSSIQGALAALHQAQALRDVAAAAFWPTLDASASVHRGRSGGQSTGNEWKVGGDANWVIDVFGERRAAKAASEADVGASQSSLGDVQVQIAAEVALNYILWRTAQARTVIALENLASQEDTLQITVWRQQAGLVTSLEAEQARAAVEQNRAQVPLLQTSVLQTQHALAVLTGRAPAALSGPAGPAGTAAIPQPREGLALSVPADTLRQRPDVRAAEYQVQAALSRVGQAQAQRWPSFAIGGSLGLSAATAAGLGSGGSVLANLLASITLPVFDGGALRAQVRAQQAGVAQAQQVYRASVLGALQQVEDALVALHGDRLRLLSLRLAANSAANAALLARQRYQSGLIDFQTVLETQRTQFATQDGVALARADLSSDHVRLFKALGGGWSTDSRAPHP